MADNYYQFDNIIYGIDINADTVWSSHDANNNLISQRIYGITGNNAFHAVCDIPCYPTGLFLHLDITGPQRISKPSSLGGGSWYITEDFVVKYYPYSGRLEVYATEEENVFYSLTINYSWGSAVPKTYCSGDETIFGYHDFEWLLATNDLQAKWYWSNRSGVRNEKSARAGINELKNLSNLIFVDPNLWMFKEITDTVSADEYPLYKEEDSKEPIPVPEGEEPKSLDKHRALYKITPDGESKTHYYLTPVGRSYRLSKENKEYYGFDYGYMSNASHGNEYKKGKVVTISQFPVDNKPVQNLVTTSLTEDKKAVFYHHYAQSTTEPQLISRYGVQGNAVKSMIKDSSFLQVQPTIKWLMEGKNNLLYQRTEYSSNHPLVIYFHNNPQTILKGATKLLDQFHFLCQDKVYRIPLNWDVTICLKETSINNYYIHTSGSATNEVPAFLSLTSGEENWSNVIFNLSHSKLMSFSGRWDTTPIYEWKNCNWKYQMSIPVCAVYWQPNSSNTVGEKTYTSFPLLRPSSQKTHETYNQYWSVNYHFMSDSVLINDSNFPIFNSLPFGGTLSDVTEKSEKDYIIKLQTNNLIIDDIDNEEVEWKEEELIRLGSRWKVSHLTKLSNNTTGLFYKSSNFWTYHFHFLWETLEWDFTNYVYGWSTISFPGYSLNLSGAQGHQITLNNNILITDIEGQCYERTITSSAELTSNIFENFGPTSSFATASYNGIPLIPLNCSSTSLGEWTVLTTSYTTYEKYKFFFNAYKDWTGDGGCFGCDAYFQFFNQQKHPSTFFYVVTYPINKNTTLVEKTKTFNVTYNSASGGTRIPIEIDTGLTINDSVYDLIALPGGSWPRFEGSVELINNKYIIKGNLVFYGGGSSGGTTTITLKYKIYE